MNRKFQALNTEFNVLYNGNVALEKGVVELKLQHKDDYWNILPIERMTISNQEQLPGQKNQNSNFALSEEKATKAIQKRSMNIKGKEKNSQIDEAHILLGKSRYYEQRFVPALEAFNYILFKYPESDKIYEAKIWREKTNMRLDNDAIAIKNLRKLLKDIKFKKQIIADANAALAQAFINLGEKDSAVSKIKLARDFTKSKEEKARYRFILGQLYEQLNYKDSAFASFQTVIDMKRKSPKAYVIHAHNRQSLQFDYVKGDTVVFLEKYKKLFEDRENRPYLDQLNYQMALFYDNQKKIKQADLFYKKSLRTNSADQYLVASNYRSLGKIYFDKAKYKDAGMYFDSTLTRLTPKTREFNAIQKKRENLNDVIKYETIALENDSILNIVSLSKLDQISFYDSYIAKIKKADEAKAKLEKEAADKAAQLAKDSDNANNNADDSNNATSSRMPKDGFAKDAAATTNFGPKNTANTNEFYFYNPQTVAYGKIEFRKKWGKRAFKNNWRLSSDQIKSSSDEASAPDIAITEVIKDSEVSKELKPEYTSDFYIQKLPTNADEIANLSKERDFAYYQLGVIYKEKFKEYALAATKLEQLLDNKPIERLILPSQYNLFKIYEIIDKDKAVVMKNKIIADYPTSRYAQIISNPNSKESLPANAPEAVYASVYKKYENGKLFEVLEESTISIDKFIGTEVQPKFELLKANVIGRLEGLEAFKKALNFVALTYPNILEGKSAEQLLIDNIPKMEALKFYHDKPSSWKILYQFQNKDSIAVKPLIAKVQKFIDDKKFARLKYSIDIYNTTASFVVLHNLRNEDFANGIVGVLKEYKEYKVKETSIVISNENYKIVQIKKNLEEYFKTPKTEPLNEPTVSNPNATNQGQSLNQNQNLNQNPNQNNRQNPSRMPPGGFEEPNTNAIQKPERSQSAPVQNNDNNTNNQPPSAPNPPNKL